MDTNRKIYILGVILGVSISIVTFLIASLFLKNNFNNQKFEEEIKALKIENESLKKENEENNKDLKVEEDKKDRKQVKILIDENMTNSDIANLLVEKNIYPHKKDIMMLLELIKIKNKDYTFMLEIDGIVKYGGDFIINIDRIGKNRKEAAEALNKAGFVEDVEAFENLLYLEHYSNGIVSGEKEFREGMSLMELADVLTRN